ncbi:hypothetical protein [Poriferisphaera corsica]|nr:hypothetical protein [Poriferisphaera corsica]
MANKSFGQFQSPIIHDPTNGIQLIESVRDSIQKAVQMIKQIDQMAKTLKGLANLKMPGIGDGFGDVNSALKQVADQEEGLDNYPVKFDGQITVEQMIDLDQQAAKAVRDFADKVKSAAEKIEQDRKAVSDRISSIIGGSNAAEGETSAFQAHNHLLSVMSVEQGKLSALRSLRARLREESQARDQSRESLKEKYREQAIESTKVLTGE